MNLEKFRELSLKKKIEWIIHYYGIAIVVIIIAIGVLSSFLYSVLCPKPISDVCVLILSDEYTLDDGIRIEDELSADTGSDVSVTIYNISDVYGNGAFSIKLNSDQVDLVICPKEQTDLMIESDYLESHEKFGDADLYLCIPKIARTSDALYTTIDYFKTNKY